MIRRRSLSNTFNRIHLSLLNEPSGIVARTLSAADQDTLIVVALCQNVKSVPSNREARQSR
jgi:hypothetical protein